MQKDATYIFISLFLFKEIIYYPSLLTLYFSMYKKVSVMFGYELGDGDWGCFIFGSNLYLSLPVFFYGFSNFSLRPKRCHIIFSFPFILVLFLYMLTADVCLFVWWNGMETEKPQFNVWKWIKNDMKSIHVESVIWKVSLGSQIISTFSRKRKMKMKRKLISY